MMNAFLQDKIPTEQQLRAWCDDFHKNGFLVIKNVLNPEYCQQLKADLERDITNDSSNRQDGTIQFSHRMFERSQANLNLFECEPIVSFAEYLIGEANGRGWHGDIGIPNSNIVHVIHNNSFVVPPRSEGLAQSAWHQDDSPHLLSLDDKPITNVRLNVMTFTVNYYLTDVLEVENGPTQAIPGSHLFGRFCPPNIENIEDYRAKIHNCLAPMGSAVCFNNQVWHRGAPNSSNTARYITQITYGKRLVGHKYYPFMNYQMPEHCYEQASPRLRRLLGFLPSGAYG